MAVTYHVAKTGADTNDGSLGKPFLTIGAAADMARPGDTVTVHEGVYREWVNPRRGGLSNTRRITYQAADGEEVIIKGSERIQGWEPVSNGVWKTVIPNTFWGGYNPYAEIITGDWLVYPVERPAHPGCVYLNGMSFYETASYESLFDPQTRETILDDWTNETVPVKDPVQTVYLWYSEAGAENTAIYANFHEADPNRELVEINVRKCCFYPENTGVDYITVRGFEMAHAATPWVPPTADQPGLIGAHWSKGWIIENNIIHDSKCSGISIGKEISTGNNFRTFRKDKPGYQYQLESVFAACKIGWSKEKIGSHIIRNNVIYDCGQNGIVGHLGCVFSEIYGNHIYNIAIKREFYGYEIAGIKLHAAIDVQIHHNRIHDCSLGTWLDWQAQGARVSKNLYYNNCRDLFIEVTHGPHLVEHNIFTARYAFDNHAQGGAYVHNLFAGEIVLKKMLNRATPYHTPHSTDVTGYAFVYGGDDRLYGNMFIGETAGVSGYEGCTASLEDYISAVDKIPGDNESFDSVEQPVYIAGNAYFNGAASYSGEPDKLYRPDFDAQFILEESDGGVYLCIALPDGFDDYTRTPHGTETLGRVRVVDAEFENPDGSSLTIDTDFLDTPVTEKVVTGPLACLKAGKNRIKIW